MSFTLLLTCVGGEFSPEVIRTLKASPRHEITVVGVDARADAVGRHFVDAFALVPRGDEAGYVEAVAEIAGRHGVDLILPTSDEEALAMAAGRQVLEGAGHRLACADVETLRTVANKAQAYARLEAIGVPSPVWRQADSLEALEAAIDAVMESSGEAVVKPAAGRGGRGVFVIRRDLSGAQPYHGGREIHLDRASFTREHLAGCAEHLPAVVMERLVEPVFDIDLLAWEGRPVRVVPRRRVDSALPNEGHTMVGNADLVALGTRLIEGLGLTWLYDCDVMYDQGGTPRVLEINPRPSGSIAATIAAGVPLLDDMISLAKGEAVADLEVPVGRVVIPFKSVGVSGA